jgi:hypothetical protein
MVMVFSYEPPANQGVAWRADNLHKTRKSNPEHDAIPEGLSTHARDMYNAFGMTQLRSVVAAPESKTGIDK